MSARTVIIASRVFEPEAAAAAYRLGNLARALARRGDRVLVLTSRSPAARRGTSTIRRWPVLRDRSGAVRGYLPYLSFDVPLFFRLLVAPRADLIVAEPPPTTGFAVLIAARLRGIEYVYFAADVTSSALRAAGVNGVVAAAVTALERLVLRRASAVLAVSDGVVAELVALGAQRSRIALVGTGIDTQRFSPVGHAEMPGHRYFIYTGTMSEVHGAEVFVRAFHDIGEEFPDVRLYMFGGGVHLHELRRLAEARGDRVLFPGYVDGDVLAPWIRGAVAGLASVNPGSGYEFSIATKALANAACGTPVIFAGSGATRAIFEELRLGWHVEWDVAAVAGAMRAALRGGQRLDAATVDRLRSRYSLRAVADRAAAAVDDAGRKKSGAHGG